MVCWILPFYLFVQYIAPIEFTSDSIDSSTIFIKTPSKNEIHGFSTIVSDPANDFRPRYSLSFDNLKIINGKVGLFRTALSKQVNLGQSHINLYSYTPDLDSTASHAFDLNSALQQLAGSLPGQITEMFGSQRENREMIETLLEAVRLDITDFQLNWLHDDQNQLTIQSKRAGLTALEPDRLMLRGAVSIQTPETIVQSNHIVWDINQQLFIVKGSYVLTRDGEKQFGLNICFDSQLNVQETRMTSLEPKGDTQCIAKK